MGSGRCNGELAADGFLVRFACVKETHKVLAICPDTAQVLDGDCVCQCAELCDDGHTTVGKDEVVERWWRW